MTHQGILGRIKQIAIEREMGESLWQHLLGSQGDTPASTFYEYREIPEGPGRAELKSILALLPPVSLAKGPWICGGAPRRLLEGASIKGGDVDFFFADRASWQKFCDALDGHAVVFKSQRAMTFLVNGQQVQMINRTHYGSLEQVFRDFDFSVCQVATNGKMLALTRQAAKDVETKTLRIAPLGTVSKHFIIARMVKYLNHGFTPEPGLFQAMLLSGLSCVSSYAIFNESESSTSMYEKENDALDEGIAGKDLDDEVLREAARDLGLEIDND